MKEARTVMVLDDEAIVGDILKEALEEAGYAVEVFTDSAQAVQRLEGKSFDALITDMKMQGPSGMDVLRFVKKRSPLTHVIIITGYATIETNHEALTHGADQFIAKPFKAKDILNLLENALR